jgi:S-DNA-T family DNA segregation ATPase FtsK/SpoIIIE
MKLKLGLTGPGDSVADLVITVEPSVTIGDLAAVLAGRDPRTDTPNPAEPVTLAIWNSDQLGVSIRSDLTLLAAGLRSGSTVRIVADQTGPTHVANLPAMAKIRVLSGPDSGAEFDVPAGTSYIGRDPSCDIHLTDTMVSKRHAKLHVTTVAELVDTNSSNGILVDDEQVSRVVLHSEDVAVLGDTSIAVSMMISGGTSDDGHGTAIPFIRSPRISPLFVGAEIETPDLPTVADSPRLPIFPLIIPIVLGVVIYLITKSTLSIAFVALSPAMLTGNFLESRTTRRRTFAQQMASFRTHLSEIDNDLTQSEIEEQRIRLMEHPSSADVAAAIDGLRPLTWTRRPGEAGFLEVRLGLGPRPSRTTLKPPENAQRGGEGLSEALDVAARHSMIDSVPVVADLKALGSLGISGDDDLARDLARCVLTQITGLHSPAEVVVAGLASPHSAVNWDWLKWTPHVTSPHSPLASPPLATGRGACLNLVAELEALIDARRDRESDERHTDVWIILLVEDDAPIERSRLVEIAEQGSPFGVSVIWCAPATEQLPAACKTYLEVDRNASVIRAVFVNDRDSISMTEVERIDLATSLRIARRLSPLVDVGAGIDDESDLPNSVSWVTLAGPSLAGTPHAVLERWAESNSIIDRSPGSPRKRIKDGGLRALIGRSATDSLHLDLRAHGPHALVGGTTGSGKSELLQSWILATAAGYSPDRVTFLLIDYKGGSAFGDCKDLPHTVGMVTDLSLHLARRALTSLVAEVRYREQVLSRKRAKDLIELERSGDPEAPPSLIIVIDEFAALVQELPQFIDGIVNVAQRGRSLGLHLILATQRPAGVIKDNLRANTNLRIALRMADEADSIDVLGSPIAASFDPTIPGRASAKLGPGRLVSFQTAYVGGRTFDVPETSSIVVEDLMFGPVREWNEPLLPVVDATHTPEVADIELMVEAIRSAAELGGIPPPRLPWLSELAPIYELLKLPTTRRDTEIVIGVQDDPNNQAQPIAVFHPDRDGNMVIFGTGGAGKSTTLRTMAISAGFNVRGGPCRVYGLDFGSRGLDVLQELPHVGGIVNGDDTELVIRLLRMLREEIDRRAARYAEVRAGSITDYRLLASEPDEPRILLLVDSVGAFRQNYETGDRSKWLEAFVSIAQEGRPLGIHVIVTADRPAALTSSLASTMQRRILLRLANDSDMAMLGAPVGGIDAASPPGRGFYNDLELQIAVLGGSANVAEQAGAINKLAAAMRRNDVRDAPVVERLRDQIMIGELSSAADSYPVIGLSEDTLGAVSIAPAGTFVISGPPGSGRTTALATIAMAVRRWNAAAPLYYFGQSNASLGGLLDWSTVAFGADDVAKAAMELTEAVANGVFDETPIAVFVDAVTEFLNTTADTPLQGLIKAMLGARKFVVVEGEPASLSGSWPLLQAIKVSRRGLALQPDQSEGHAIFKTPFPRVNRVDFPPGRGFLVGNGLAEVVQVALPE